MTKQKKSSRKRSKPAAALSQLTPGMPALENVQEVKDFVSPQGDKYKILKTTETDAYDQPLAKSPKQHRKPGH